MAAFVPLATLGSIRQGNLPNSAVNYPQTGLKKQP